MTTDGKEFLIVLTVIGLIIWGCFWIKHLDTKIFVEAGYTQTTFPGVEGAKWVKK